MYTYATGTRYYHIIDLPLKHYNTPFTISVKDSVSGVSVEHLVHESLIHSIQLLAKRAYPA